MTVRRDKIRHQLYVVTDYWDEHFGHRPYVGMLHDEDDRDVHATDVLERAMRLARVHDGDEIMVVVLKTGRRPLGARKMRWTRPHEYTRESEGEAKARRRSGKK
ncbi:MAG TPA: hypothetical protein VFA98_06310 [Thermoanaerobaculia bacterium]|nr:hypothetical protein [Thermoanaerobaculia bacterium]